MKKIALMAALAMIVAIPAEAATKKKGAKKPAAAAAKVDPNSLPSLYPAPIKFIMFHGQKEAAAKPAKKGKKKK
jgi:PBP1b-binding outer membrane lipoprotein LpoB